jgi:TonB family protein
MNKNHFFTTSASARRHFMRRLFRIVFLVSGFFASVGASYAANLPDVVKPRVLEEPVWAYPLAAERDSVDHGEARAVLSLDEEGRLTDFLLVGCTHPAFAEAVANSLPEYRFAPARVHGEPAPVRMPVTFWFQQEGRVVSMTSAETISRYIERFMARDRFTSWICPGERLDRPLSLVDMPSPGYPKELLARGEGGEVTIDFFVDGLGRVRMPAADPTVQPSFAREAVAALGQWHFEPPTSQGTPVIVHVVQTFHFTAPEKNAMTDQVPKEEKTAMAARPSR